MHGCVCDVAGACDADGDGTEAGKRAMQRQTLGRRQSDSSRLMMDEIPDVCVSTLRFDAFITVCQ